MTLVTREADGVIVVMFPAKSIDASNSNQVKEAVVPFVQPESRVVFDLGQIDFIDSTGLGMLVGCLRKSHAVKGDIRLCELRKPVRALFELVRMHRVFEIFNTADEAVRSYQG